MATLEAFGKRVVGYMPFAASASAVTYDDTVSGISATNVQDALDELAGYKEIITIATSTVDTFADGLTAIKPYYDALPTYQKMSAVLRIGSYYLPTDYIGGGFCGIVPDASYINLLSIRMNTYEYSRVRIKKSDVTITYNDLSANVRNSILTLYAKK